jgi:IS5 family transposase
MMQSSFFDLDKRYAKLSEAGDPLERLNAAIDWEMFRSTLERIDAKPRKSAAGRPPTCRIVMFKMLLLQRLHQLSDERLEYQVTDRLSFMRFLGLELAGLVPDSRTVWAFREALKKNDLMQPLLDKLTQALGDMGVELKSGQIIDASFIPVPIQRNGREENAQIKADKTPEEWMDNAHKLRHKDVDARWTKKGGQSHYGYKNHINIDKDTKLITAHACTDASVHDSQELDTVLRTPAEGGKDTWADSAYRSEEQEKALQASQHNSHIHERAYRNHPLTEEQKATNKTKSKVRARVEHVFGHMENTMGGMGLRTIGLARAKVGVALMNLTYNISRIEILMRTKVFSFSRLLTPKMGQVA